MNPKPFKTADTVNLSSSDFQSFNLEEGIDWAGLVDHLKSKCGFTEDRQVCQYMGIPPSTLSSLRRGRAELSVLTKIRLLDRFGFHLVSEAVELLLTDEMAAKARRARRRQAAKNTP